MRNNIYINCVTFNSADFSSWVKGVVRNMPETFCGITQDTRKLKPGMLYVALRGENFDGHSFVTEALAAGASAALVNQGWIVPEELSGAPLVQVADTRDALLKAAHAWRKLCSAKVVGITGSSGKTTTKEIAAAMLSAGGKVCCTAGNMNNDVGLPLSVLSMSPDCDFGVFELGSNHPGEISLLADILQPDFGVITSVGSAHIENFGSQEAIVREKGALLSSVCPDGCAFLNMEISGYSQLKKMADVPVVKVSLCNKDADFYGRITDEMSGRITVTSPDSRYCAELESRLPGKYNAANLLIAFALACTAGISSEAAAQALTDLKVPGMRWQRVKFDNGVEIINDAYNANPESVKAVLNLFQGMACEGRKIVVLGDMLELGDFAPQLHSSVGAAVAETKPDLLYTVGALSSQYTSDAALAEGYPQQRIMRFKDASNAGQVLKNSILSNDLILLKASRGMKLEGVLEQLK